MPVERASYQKNLGIYLDKTFQYILKLCYVKVNKGISIIIKQKHALPRKSSSNNYNYLQTVSEKPY